MIPDFEYWMIMIFLSLMSFLIGLKFRGWLENVKEIKDGLSFDDCHHEFEREYSTATGMYGGTVEHIQHDRWICKHCGKRMGKNKYEEFVNGIQN